MIEDYQPLSSFSLAANAGYYQPTQDLPERVTLDGPALDVMTDLKQVTTLTVSELASIDTANQKMQRRGVHMLFVVSDTNAILGLITATDILGEKPMQVIQSNGGQRRDILVRDIMTPQPMLEVMDFAEASRAKVGHVVATLAKSGRQHALAVEVLDPSGNHMVRGIFSLSMISRKLGVSLHTTEVARTFSEINATLAR